jgi:hypothetical protein
MPAEKAEAHASAAPGGEGGRNLAGPGAGAEVRAVAAGETKPEVPGRMEVVVERSPMRCAYERVVANEGAPGVDGLTVSEFEAVAQGALGEGKRRCGWARTCHRRCVKWKYRSRKAGYGHWASRRGWIVCFNKRGIRFCNRCLNPSFPSRVNRRMRNRKSGGVGGRRE